MDGVVSTGSTTRRPRRGDRPCRVLEPPPGDRVPTGDRAPPGDRAVEIIDGRRGLDGLDHPTVANGVTDPAGCSNRHRVIELVEITPGSGHSNGQLWPLDAERP